MRPTEKWKQVIWWGGILLLVMFVIMALRPAEAGRVHNHYHYYEAPDPSPAAAPDVTNITILGESERKIIGQAAAAAMAAGSCQFDYSTAMQGCASTWTYDDEWAINFQVGKRIDDLLINGGISCGLDDGDIAECGLGGGINWHF